MMDLDQAVQAARTAYAAARPQSAGWADRARRVMPGGNTRSVLQFDPFPFRVERAHGRLLFDIDGYEYLDGSVHSDEVRLAELIVDRFPSIDQVRFTNSGTEANLMALAVATHHTGRSKIVVFENGYHGGVITFGSGPNPVNVPHDWLILPYNDRAAFEAAMAEHGDRVAAVLVEPMQGSGGCIPGDPDFLAVLRSASTQHASVLIFDEVMTSRLAVGGAQEQTGITPDMTTLGKYLAGGLSFGAFGGRDDLMAAFDPRRGGTLGHAGTFNNNVASMAGGRRTARNEPSRRRPP
jgi:glutamate-1-semialdehyde 2,1-aminomutase